jgi:catechol 2,3-dioxygenase-like lactoylglutathione lyase family enzyme
MRFEEATPVLRSADYPRSRDFFVRSLGFEVIEEGGDPPRFGIFRRGGSILYVDAWNGPPSPISGGWQLYIHVVGLEEVLAEFHQAGVAVSREPETTVYGMREFEITDPDGNVICFGEDVPAS